MPAPRLNTAIARIYNRVPSISKQQLKQLIKEAAISYIDSQQSVLQEADDQKLLKVWDAFEEWHRHGMGRWEGEMYPTEVAAALQNMYTNRRAHMLKYVENALGRGHKSLAVAQKLANKLFVKAIKTEKFLARLAESSNDRAVTKQLVRNAAKILQTAVSHFSKTSSPSGAPLHSQLEAIVKKHAGGHDDADDL